jgi:hypothetical protein
LKNKTKKKIIIKKDYFTDPNLRQKVNNLLNQNDIKTDVNKMVQQMKTHKIT